ncbi:MAG: EutN/CcmL family microcompartment protein [Spirochaetota bacterium]|nr:EutN/CcmL family microcompartment protein [Spirochaetota bacterium]
MLIAIVRGSVVSSQKDKKIENLKMLLLEKVDPKTLKGKGDFFVAIDTVGAGLDEIVLFASGSSARMTELTTDRPCDCVIMAIIDEYDINGKTIYKKDL